MIETWINGMKITKLGDEQRVHSIEAPKSMGSGISYAKPIQRKEHGFRGNLINN